jgi:hypothetical protein
MSKKLIPCYKLYKSESVKNMENEGWYKAMPIIQQQNNGKLPINAYKKWKKEFKEGFMFGCNDIRKTKNHKKTIKNIKKKFGKTIKK